MHNKLSLHNITLIQNTDGTYGSLSVLTLLPVMLLELLMLISSYCHYRTSTCWDLVQNAIEVHSVECWYGCTSVQVCLSRSSFPAAIIQAVVTKKGGGGVNALQKHFFNL